MQNYIDRAAITHNNYYDYSKVIFTTIADKVTIVCPKHGNFQQRFHAHINGAGCANCAYEKRSQFLRLSLEEFITRSNVIHNNKYDYSKVKFKLTKDKVTIVCPKHGDFQQFVSGHLSGYGCFKCAQEARVLTQKEFVRRCQVKHNYYYDYSKTVYMDSRDKVTIVCPKHGEFQQHSGMHMRGSKCPKCAKEERFLTAAEFIKKAREIHGDFYGYDDVIYTGIRGKVQITCPEHGNFSQIPNSHLSGSGCPLCALDNAKLTDEEFKIKAKAIHGDRYDYSKTVYVSSREKVTITCPTHGDFLQEPNTHLNSGGCYQCGRDKLKRTVEEFIQQSKKVHREKYSYKNTKYLNECTNVIIVCPSHGEFSQLPRVHLKGSGCPRCKASKGELTVERILKENNIKYTREYMLPEVLIKYRYDFYLPEYRALVEFHGIQHFEPIEYFGGEETFNYVVRNDRFKRYFAAQFKYRLIELDYKQLYSLSDEDFSNLLLTQLAKLGKV